MPRCNVDQTGNGVLQTKWWPVTEVLAIQLSSSRAFPRVWTPVTAGQWDIRHPLISIGDSASATAPDGGWTIDVAPGWISWDGCGRGVPTANGYWRGAGGRGGLRVQLAYFNGWPHTSLTDPVDADATVLTVDDVTGWTNASGFAYDGSATEPLSVESVSAANPVTLPNDAGTVQAGPGTITLASPLNFSHQQGTLISALPADVMQAAILACSMQALEGGIDAITIQDVSGGHSSTGMDTDAMAKMFAEKLGDYRRVM